MREALDNLGIDEVRANELGLRILKIGMPWPLEPQIITKFARDLDLIIVVEEKRKLIEVQVKEAIFDDRRGRREAAVVEILERAFESISRRVVTSSVL